MLVLDDNFYNHIILTSTLFIYSWNEWDLTVWEKSLRFQLVFLKGRDEDCPSPWKNSLGYAVYLNISENKKLIMYYDNCQL